ncbi:hypothetical protein AAC387_Pa02g0037 [Persea americana]
MKFVEQQRNGATAMNMEERSYRKEASSWGNSNEGNGGSGALISILLLAVSIIVMSSQDTPLTPRLVQREKKRKEDEEKARSLQKKQQDLIDISNSKAFLPYKKKKLYHPVCMFCDTKKRHTLQNP